MKVGKEIRSRSHNVTSKIISVAVVSKKTGGISLPKIATVAIIATAITLLPMQLRWSIAQADYDPVQLAQMWNMVKAVESGADIDPVHIAQAAAFKTQYGAAPAAPTAQPQQAPITTQVFAAGYDADPAHAEALATLIKAVQAGADTDPVHIAQVNAALAAGVNATTGVLAAAPTVQVATKQSSAQAPVVAAPQPAATPAPVIVLSSSNPLNGLNFYVNKYSPAANQANAWRASRPADAAKMDILSNAPTAQWFGSWNGDIQGAVRTAVSSAAAQGQTAVLVAYNIPQRDCGGFSSGGETNYTNWIGEFSRGIGSNSAVVILEPDALSLTSCLSANDLDHRQQLLAGAVSILKSNPNTRVYLDAGHSKWVSPDVIATRLQKANVSKADGFFTNVSNFMTTGDEVSYGIQVSNKLGGKHFVVDTSRNGNGPTADSQWCNPWGRSIGQKPTTNTGNSLVDAFLWIKTPGESDGNCNGGPSAGTWWPDYALSLVR